MVAKIRRTFLYVLTLLAVFVMAMFLSSCGNPRKGMTIDMSLVSTEKVITYDADGNAFLSLTKELDENGNLTNAGKAELKISVLKGGKNVLRTISAESSDSAKVGVSYYYNEDEKATHVFLEANGATSDSASTYVNFVSDENSNLFKRLYVRVDEKATTMNFANNIETCEDQNKNIVLTNIGIFEDTPFHMITNKIFKFGPNGAVTPNLSYGVKNLVSYSDGGEILYSTKATAPENALKENMTVTGKYADGTDYTAIEFSTQNVDDKTNNIFVKRFRIPVYESLSSSSLSVFKTDSVASDVLIETLYEEVLMPINLAGYVGFYVQKVEDGKTEYVLVTNENMNSVGIILGVTKAYKKADIDSQIVFINNKNNEMATISLGLEPANDGISYAYLLDEPDGSYTILNPQTQGLTRQSAYYGKYIKQNGKYVLISESNFNSLNIVVGRTPAYSYSRTITVSQNTNMNGEKLNSFTITGWRESLSGTKLTFYASYDGFLRDDDITVIPTAQKTILVKVVNLPTTLYVNDKGVSYTVVTNDDKTPKTSFGSLEEFWGEDGSGLYYYRAGENVNTYSYVLINKSNYSTTSKQIFVNGNWFDLDYSNLDGTPVFEEATQEIAVFDVNAEAQEQKLYVELGGFSSGYDGFYVYADSNELAKNGERYKNYVTILNALRLYQNGTPYVLMNEIDGVMNYTKLEFLSGTNLFISATTNTSLNGEIPIVVEAKHNSGKKLLRKIVLRFAQGIEEISATTTKVVDGTETEVEVTKEEGITLFIPANQDMNAQSLQSEIRLSVLPLGSATYTSLVDGKLQTYLSVSIDAGENKTVAEVGYVGDDGFVNNQINPDNLSFVVRGLKFGSTKVAVSAQNGARFVFNVKVEEVVSNIVINADSSTIPANTFWDNKEVLGKQTLSSMMIPENVSNLVLNVSVFPENAKILNAERYYITQDEFVKINSESGDNSFLTKVFLNMTNDPSKEELTYLDGIDTTVDRNIIVNKNTNKKFTITTTQRNYEKEKNTTYVFVAFVYSDENGENKILYQTFDLTLYKAISKMVYKNGDVELTDVSLTLLANSSLGNNNPYLTSQMSTTLGVDISENGTNVDVSQVLWYYVDSDDSILTGGVQAQDGGIVAGRVKMLPVAETSQTTGRQKSVIGVFGGDSGVIVEDSWVPQDLKEAIASRQYTFIVGEEVLIESTALTAADNTSVTQKLRACVLDVNGVVHIVKFTITVQQTVLVEKLNVYDYDEDSGIYFETSQKMSVLPAGEDRLARQNSNQENDVDGTSQKEDINVSIQYSATLPTVPTLEYIMFDAIVDENGKWEIDESVSSRKTFSSSSVWLGYNEALNKYFVTPIGAGNTILYVIPRDQMIMLNEEITAANIKAVLGAIKNSAVIKEFHITVADGYKTYIRLSNQNDFEKLANNEEAWDKNYYVTNDIDISRANFGVIGTDKVPFSGKLVSMPIVKVENYNAFIVDGKTYYVTIEENAISGNTTITIKDSESEQILIPEIENGKTVYTFDGANKYALVDEKLVKYSGEQVVEEIPIIRESKQTSILPTHTIYGIKLNDTTNGVSNIKTTEEKLYSYYGLFGVLAGNIERVDFRFDEVNFESVLDASSYSTTVYVGALAGKVLKTFESFKTYETIEGYYGKYVFVGSDPVEVNEQNASVLLEGWYDGLNKTYTRPAYFAPSLIGVQIQVKQFNSSLTSSGAVFTVYVGAIGQNGTGRIENIETNFDAQIFAQSPQIKMTLGGFVGLNDAGFNSVYANTNIVLNSGCGNGFVVGGVVGENNGSLSNISASGQIALNGTFSNEIFAIGGLCGFSTASITFSQSSVACQGGQYVGGLVGSMNGGLILGSSYSIYDGTQYGLFSYQNASAVGGLVGLLQSAQIEESYVMAYTSESNINLYGRNFVGGLVGEVQGNSSLKKCFVSAGINGAKVGGLVGRNNTQSGEILTIENTFVKGKIVSQADTNGVFVGGLLIGADSAGALSNISKTYVSAQSYKQEVLVLTPVLMDANGSFAPNCGVYVLNTSFKNSDNEKDYITALSFEEMRVQTEIEGTTFFKNPNMEALGFYQGIVYLQIATPTTVDAYVGHYVLIDSSYVLVDDENKNSLEITAGTTKAYDLNSGDDMAWTVGEQNDGEPILRGLFPTIPQNINALEKDDLPQGVYALSNNQVVVSLSDYYEANGNNLTMSLATLFKLQILPNKDGSIELVNSTEDELAISELRKIWINVSNTNSSVLETSLNNLYDLKLILSGNTGTSSITIKCAQNPQAQITLDVCVVEGFDDFKIFDSEQNYVTGEDGVITVNKNLVLVQERLSKALEVTYNQNKKIIDADGGVSIASTQVLNPLNLNAGFMIEFKEGYFAFNGDKFKQVLKNGNMIQRTQILQEFIDGSFDEEIIKSYYPTNNVKVTETEDYYLITIDDYNYAKINKNPSYNEIATPQNADDYVGKYVLSGDDYVLVTAGNASLLNIIAGTTKAFTVTENETFVYAFVESLKNITIFAQSVGSEKEITVTKYYVFENASQKAPVLLSQNFKLFVKVYSGIQWLDVEGVDNLTDMGNLSPTGTFKSEITFNSDSNIDKEFGTNMKLFVLNTKTIHAANTVVYDEDGLNPQVFATIKSYYGKYIKFGDEFVLITEQNSSLSPDGLTLTVFDDGEELVFTYDAETKEKEIQPNHLNKFIPNVINTLNGNNEIVCQEFSFALMQSYYKTLNSVLVFRLEVENVDEMKTITKSVYFKFSPEKATILPEEGVKHFTDADLEEGDGTMSSNYLTNSGVIPTDKILAGDYGLLQIVLEPEHGLFDSLTVTGTGSNGDKISFIQRVKEVITLKENDKVVNRTRYYLFDGVSQKENGEIVPQAVSNYYDGTVSLMINTTKVFNLTSTISETTFNSKESWESAENEHKYYYLEKGNYIKVNSDNFKTDTSMFELVFGEKIIDNFDSLDGFFFKYEQNYIKINNLSYINESTRALKVTDEVFDYDGNIYLQTLIAKQTTTATNFVIDSQITYDGETKRYQKTLEVDTSVALSWGYDKTVENPDSFVIEAYIAKGTQNTGLHINQVGTFDSISNPEILKSGSSEQTGGLTVTHVGGTTYSVNASGTNIGDKYSVTIVGYKNIDGGFVREIRRTINFTVVDFILKNGAFKIEDSQNGVLDKVYTNEATYKLTIVPDFSNIEISSSGLTTFSTINLNDGNAYYYKKDGAFIRIDGNTQESDIPEPEHVYSEELKNLYELCDQLNKDTYGVFSLRTTSGTSQTEHLLKEQINDGSVSPTENKYSFTKVQYKATSEKTAEDENKEHFSPVVPQTKLPQEGIQYYYLKYVYGDGDNNGYYVTPLSQGYGSILYVNGINYGYKNGRLEIANKGISVKGDEIGNTFTYVDFNNPTVSVLQGIEANGTEIRFSQKTSIDNPIPIYTTQEFFAMNAGQHYILMNDIKITSAFAPINTAIASLDGNSKKIVLNTQSLNLSGLNVSQTANIGLFGTVSSTTVLKNLTIELETDLELNLYDFTTVNFGALAGVNNGIITNCVVSKKSGDSQKPGITLLSTDRQTDVFNVGGFVGVNNNSITNSKIEYVHLNANGLVAGFVCENNSHISACSVGFGQVKNSSNKSSTSRTAGFVLKNSSNSKVYSSHVGVAYLQNPQEEPVVKQTQEIQSIVDFGGFVYENYGEIADSFSAITLSSDETTSGFNASSGGFVFANMTSGTIARCYSISNTQAESFANAPFVGPNKQTGYNTLNYGSLNAFKDCLYYDSGFGSSMIERTKELGINSLTSDQFINQNNYYANCFEGFSVSRYHSAGGVEYTSVWAFANSLYETFDPSTFLPFENCLIMGPQLVYAHIKETPLREVSGYNNDPLDAKYTYNELSTSRFVNEGTDFNVKIIDSPLKMFKYFHDDINDESDKGTISDWYRLVCDIDLSGRSIANWYRLVLDPDESAEDVSKYVNAVFEGNFDGNGFTIKGINITSEKASYCGLFGKIQTKLITNDSITTNADKTIASVHNLNLEIDSITATDVTSVGGLCGEAENVVLSNISVVGKNPSNISIVGKNLVGGLVGKLVGSSRVSNILSEVSVSAVFGDSNTNKLTYNRDLLRVYETQIDENEFLAPNEVSANADEVLCYAGAVFGVADLTLFSSSTSVFATKSAYTEARISNLTVSGQSKVVGGTVGGAIGLVGASTYVDNVEKIVFAAVSAQNLTYIKGSRFVGGIVGENHGNLNYIRIEHEKTVQEQIDGSVNIGAVNALENTTFFNAQNGVSGEQAKGVGGLVGLNIGLSLSLLNRVECGNITNSFVKTRVDDERANYLGGLVGIAIGGNLNSNYIASSVVGAKVGVTGGLIGYVADFDDQNIKSIIANPFNGVETTGFVLKGKHYYIDSDNNCIKELSKMGTSFAITSDGAYYTFTIDGTPYYMNGNKTIIYLEAVNEDEVNEANKKMVARINKHKFVGMDEQTITINNVVAKNNYAHTDYNKIVAIHGSEGASNGVFGSLIGKTSIQSSINTSHNSGSENSEETFETNFAVAKIYSTQPSYKTKLDDNEGFELELIGQDKRETRTWASFIDNNIIRINEVPYTYDESAKQLRPLGVAVNALNDELKTFTLGEQNYIIKNNTVYYYQTSYDANAVSGSVDIDGQNYAITTTGTGSNLKITKIGDNNILDDETFEINGNYYYAEGLQIWRLSEIEESNTQDGHITILGETYLISRDESGEKIIPESMIVAISSTNYFTISNVKYYIDKNTNNVFKVDQLFDKVATSLTRYEMFANSYAQTKQTDKLFAHWDVYDYGTKQSDDSYKIVTFDAYMMPIYHPTTDVDEIKIYTEDEFLHMKSNGTYRLMNDLDFKGAYVSLFGEENSEPFSGKFIGASNSMGNGETVHTIRNLKPYKVSGEVITSSGIFAKTNKASISKLNISGITVDATLNTNFGVLIGSAQDTQISGINITEDYNYISSYVSIQRDGTNYFAYGDDLYEVLESNNFASNTVNVTSLTKVAGNPITLSKATDDEHESASLGGSTYYFFKDETLLHPYSYSASDNATQEERITIQNAKFNIAGNDYYVYMDKIYQKTSSQSQVEVVDGKFTIGEKPLTIGQSLVYEMNGGNVFQIGKNIYKLENSEIFKQLEETSSDLLCSQMFSNLFVLDGETYKYVAENGGKIVAITISQEDIQNIISLAVDGTSQQTNIGMLVGEYLIVDTPDNSIVNINVEGTLNIKSKTVGQETTYTIGGVVGKISNAESNSLLLQNVCFNGTINNGYSQTVNNETTTFMGIYAKVGGIVGSSQNTDYLNVLSLGDINLTLKEGNLLSSSIGGTVGESTEKTNNNRDSFRYEGITVLSNINLTATGNGNIFVGGFAAKFNGSIFNSLIAPNITLNGVDKDLTNVHVAGFIQSVEQIRPYSEGIKNEGKPIQNVLILTTIKNFAYINNIFAVYENFTSQKFAKMVDACRNVYYDRNLSLATIEQKEFAKSTLTIMSGSENNVKLFKEGSCEFYESQSETNVIAVQTKLQAYDGQYRYPQFVLAENNATLVDKKLVEEVVLGSKLYPKLVVETLDVVSDERIKITDIDDQDSITDTWYLQVEDIKNVNILNPRTIKGFYNGNNKTITLLSLDGVYGYKSETSDVGVFKGLDNTVISSLHVTVSKNGFVSNKLNMNLKTSADTISVGLISSTMGKNSIMFACFADGKMEIQNANKAIAVGSLVGVSDGKIISSGSNADLYVAGNSYKQVGGLVGVVVNAGSKDAFFQIEDSFYNGIIKTTKNSGTSRDYVGGLVGASFGGVLFNAENYGEYEINLKNTYVVANFQNFGNAFAGNATTTNSNVAKNYAQTNYYDGSLNEESLNSENISTFSVKSAMTNILNFNLVTTQSNTKLKDDEWMLQASKNSNLPMSVMLAGLKLYADSVIDTDAGDKKYYLVKNAGELDYYLNKNTISGNEVYVLMEDIDATQLATCAKFVETLDGQGHKILNLKQNFVGTNDGTIENIEFKNDYGTLVANSNNGTISQVLLENGTNVVGDNNDSAKILNSMVGSKAILSQMGSSSSQYDDGTIAYNSIYDSTNIDFDVWTVVGDVATQNGNLKLQLFNKTTSNLDVFGVVGDVDDGVYVVKNKEQYSAICQYLNRHNATLHIKIEYEDGKNSVDFDGMNITTLNGSVSVVNNEPKVLKNFEVSNMAMFNNISGSDNSETKNITLQNVNFYAKSKTGTQNYNLITNTTFTKITNLTITNGLFNFVKGDNNLVNAAIVAGENASDLIGITLDRLTVNTDAQNFGMIAAQNNSGAKISSSTIKNSFVNLTGATNAGAVVGQNNSTIETTTVNSTTLTATNATNLGGLAGLNQGNINGSMIGSTSTDSALVLKGNATNVGGLVGENRGTLGAVYGENNCIDNTVNKLSLQNIQAVNAGGAVGKNNRGIINSIIVGGVNNGDVNVQVTLNNGGNVGGAIGLNEGSTNITQITQQGTSITSTIAVGKINLKGTGSTEITLTDNEQTADTTSNIGGFIGKTTSGFSPSGEIVVNGAVISGTAGNIGGMIGLAKGTIVNLKVASSQIENTTQATNIGGVVGSADGVYLTAKTDELKIYGTAENVGGLVGTDQNSKSKVNIFIDGISNQIIDVDATNIGGVMGLANNSSNTNNYAAIYNTLNVGSSTITLNSKNASANVGGVVGFAQKAQQISISKELSVTLEGTSKQTNFGGLAGKVEQMKYAQTSNQFYINANILVTASANENTNTNTSTSVGGVVGFADYAAKIQIANGITLNFTSNAKATNVGGIIGLSQTTGEMTTNRSISIIGTVNTSASNAKNVGGVVGALSDLNASGNNTSSVLTISSTGTIEVTPNSNVTYAGGVIGEFNTNYMPVSTVLFNISKLSQVNINDGSTAPDSVGGVVAISKQNFNFNSSLQLTLNANATTIGGIVGTSEKGVLAQVNGDSKVSITSTNTSGVQTIGGIVGTQSLTSSIDATISESNPDNFMINAQSNTNTSTSVGGVVGTNNGKISNAQIYGLKVFGNQNVGGIAGINNGEFQTETNSQSLQVLGNVHITANSNSGLFVGVNNNNGTISGVSDKPIVTNTQGNNTVTYSGNNNLGYVISQNKGQIRGAYLEFENAGEQFSVSNATNVGLLVANNQGVIYNAGNLVESEGNKTVSLTANNSTNVGIIGNNQGVVDVQAINAGTYSISGKENVGAIGSNNASSEAFTYNNIAGDEIKNNAGTLKVAEIIINSVNGKYAGAIGFNSSTNIGHIVSTINSLSGDYVGGVIGKNTAAFDLNAGVELSSTVGSFDSNATYVGGIIGENNAQITRLTSSVTNAVSGNEYVGGFAGITTQNVQNVSVSGNVSVTGTKYVGGWFGKIASGVTLDADDDGNTITVSSVGTSGNSKYVGLIAGVNAGTIQDFTLISGSVKGTEYVGSVAGQNEGTITNVVNKIKFASTSGDLEENSINSLGGIVGENTRTGRITNATNNATVSGIQNVGGIAGVNSGSISSSTVERDGSLPNLIIGQVNVGGIVGLNSGDILNNTLKSSVQPNKFTDGNNLTYGGVIDNSIVSYNVGGIAGKSTAGNISGNTIDASENFDASNPLKIVGHTMLGGVVGYNRGDVGATTVTGNVSVVLLGVLSSGVEFDKYTMYIDGSNYLGTNVVYKDDFVDYEHLERAIATAIPVYAKDKDLIASWAERVGKTSFMTNLENFASWLGGNNNPEHGFFGVAGQAIGYDGRSFTTTGNSLGNIDNKGCSISGTITMEARQMPLKSKQLLTNYTSNEWRIDWEDNDGAISGTNNYAVKIQTLIGVYESIS